MNELAFIVQQTTPKSSGFKPRRLFLTIPWVIWTALAGAEWSRVASSLIGASAGIGGWWRLSLYGFSISDGQPRLAQRVGEGFPVLGQKLQGHMQFGLRFRNCTISLYITFKASHKASPDAGIRKYPPLPDRRSCKEFLTFLLLL